MSIIGTERAGSRQDEPFRRLVRSAQKGVSHPNVSDWSARHWSDEAVAEASRDPETVRRAWALLADDTDAGWRALWARQNRIDRYGTHVLQALLGVGVVVGLVTQSWLPIGVAAALMFVFVAVATVASSNRKAR